MRRAELIVAVLFAAFSIYIMYLAQLAPLEIGWVPQKGPGSGAFPFWLGAAMLVLSVAVFVRGWRGLTLQGRSTAPFIDRALLPPIALTVLGILAMLAITHWLGAYVAIPLFLIFYIRFLGGRSWTTTLLIALITPVVVFLFFEGGMKILLPKGITEPLFFPLYKLVVY
jgi:putative tricarboxylic transport membrane protein